MLDEIKKIDPRKKVEVGGYQLDPLGNAAKKVIQLSKSETYLTELMENICKFRGIEMNFCIFCH